MAPGASAVFAALRVWSVSVVTALAAGRITNPKTAHSQDIRGIGGGLRMALMEESIRDGRNARVSG